MNKFTATCDVQENQLRVFKGQVQQGEFNSAHTRQLWLTFKKDSKLKIVTVQGS